VFTDVSHEGLGCVFQQEDKVVTYASCQLKPKNHNYPIHDLKFTLVVFSLKVWRYYLYGVPFELYTDHKSLTYLFDQSLLQNHQKRWLELLKNYQVSIQYHPGKENVIVDALGT